MVGRSRRATTATLCLAWGSGDGTQLRSGHALSCDTPPSPTQVRKIHSLTNHPSPNAPHPTPGPAALPTFTHDPAVHPSALRLLLPKANDSATALAWTCHVLTMAGAREALNVRLSALGDRGGAGPAGAGGADRGGADPGGAGLAATAALDLLLRLVSGADTSTPLGSAFGGRSTEDGAANGEAQAYEKVSAYEWCASSATRVLVDFLTVDIDSDRGGGEGGGRGEENGAGGDGGVAGDAGLSAGMSAPGTGGVGGGGEHGFESAPHLRDGDPHLLNPRDKLRVRRHVRQGLLRLRRQRACTFLALASRPVESVLGGVDGTADGAEEPEELDPAGNGEEEEERSMVCRCVWGKGPECLRARTACRPLPCPTRASLLISSPLSPPAPPRIAHSTHPRLGHPKLSPTPTPTLA